jgi:hypothetical protein
MISEVIELLLALTPALSPRRRGNICRVSAKMSVNFFCSVEENKGSDDCNLGF